MKVENMKKLAICGVVVAGFFISALSSAWALTPEEVADIEKKANETLNGYTWNLDVTLRAAQPEDRVTTQDTVIFKDRKLNSANLSEKGFGTSNYSLTVGDDGVAIFETMQRDDNENTVFWRGEVVNGEIRGVLSSQNKNEGNKAYQFKGVKAGEATEIPAEKVEPQPEPVVVEPTPPVAVAEVPEVAAEQVAETPASEVVEAVEEVTEEIIETVEEVEEEVEEEKLPWWSRKKS